MKRLIAVIGLVALMAGPGRPAPIALGQEDDDGPGGATALMLGMTVGGALPAGDPGDWYAFVAAANVRYWCTVTGGDFYPNLVVQQGDQIGVGMATGSNTARLTATVLSITGGVVHVGVGSALGAGSYALTCSAGGGGGGAPTRTPTPTGTPEGTATPIPSPTPAATLTVRVYIDRNANQLMDTGEAVEGALVLARVEGREDTLWTRTVRGLANFGLPELAPGAQVQVEVPHLRQAQLLTLGQGGSTAVSPLTFSVAPPRYPIYLP